jgi:hypothetical protein
MNNYRLTKEVNSLRKILLGGLLIFWAANYTFAQSNSDVINKTQILLNEVIAQSFPELTNAKPRIKLFKSNDTFFKSQFSIVNFLTFTKIRTTIFVNPQVFEKNAPEAGVKGILAHELAHTIYYKNKNRLQLFGLISLINNNFVTNFERRADLVAIEKGYGEGLIQYREWLYQNISAKAVTEKKRDYLTPEEIKFLLLKMQNEPDFINNLKKNVPKNLAEIKRR